MHTVAFVDTSILNEYLGVPGKCDHPEETREEIALLKECGIILILPVASIIETGNHIAQSKQADGNVKRLLGEALGDVIKKTLAGEAPWTLGARPLDFTALADLAGELPDAVQQGVGAGDLSIIHAFHDYCLRDPYARVYIWSKDHHLKSFDRSPRPGTSRRRT